jgi:hypothetical protein
MKVVARAWRTLQRLSPTERAALASEVGIDGAEELVERMASKHGRLKPAAILQVLEKARGTPPAHLRDLLRGLRDPRRRRQILKQGLDAVTAELVDDPLPVPAPDPQEASPEAVVDPPKPAAKPQVATPAKAQSVPRPAAATGAAAAAAVAGAALASKTKAAQPGPSHHAESPKPISPAQAEPTVPPPPVTTAPRRQTPHEPQAPEVTRPGARGAAPRPVRRLPPDRAAKAPSQATPRLVETPIPVASAEELVAAVGKAGGVIGRLRDLRTHARRARGLDVEALRRLLDLFPSPWARRRALTALLDEQVPDNLADALALIEDLESPGARRWCLGTILEKWPVSDTVRAQLLARRRRPNDSGAAVSHRL